MCILRMHVQEGITVITMETFKLSLIEMFFVKKKLLLHYAFGPVVESECMA